jgi:hypothetical protein
MYDVGHNEGDTYASAVVDNPKLGRVFVSARGESESAQNWRGEGDGG